MAFEWPLRVYIEDTDAGGIVFYANYLRYMERARSEWLRSFGFEQQALMQAGVRFVVRDLNIRYRKAAVLDDQIVATTDLAEITKAGMTLNQTVIRRSESAEKTEERTEELLVDAQVRVACINNEGRPAAIPADIVALMKT
ncbi:MULTISPECIES: tol-pal system-associated acyl-CoA thioesterase [Thalassolituus]|uniref:tol-pal system-associated acyl-CoA thioesterase n=1 Tax=Thalassolituus TaxID=187492 RepID=UPI000C4C2CE9|nr:MULTISPECIES: tol-pal system-associated acyl-CoA thioesterase [Thalassolituus]MAX87360.1 tol-pal system-associated acyl-CoA thioesterase [Oceanospirillaceae bacterium]|tara:strand:+ start:1971 stop:2393 length:423 start_codon:yes stop_codon:yes gene_type:complete